MLKLISFKKRDGACALNYITFFNLPRPATAAATATATTATA